MLIFTRNDLCITVLIKVLGSCVTVEPKMSVVEKLSIDSITQYMGICVGATLYTSKITIALIL